MPLPESLKDDKGSEFAAGMGPLPRNRVKKPSRQDAWRAKQAAGMMTFSCTRSWPAA